MEYVKNEAGLYEGVDIIVDPQTGEQQRLRLVADDVVVQIRPAVNGGAELEMQSGAVLPVSLSRDAGMMVASVDTPVGRFEGRWSLSNTDKPVEQAVLDMLYRMTESRNVRPVEVDGQWTVSVMYLARPVANSRQLIASFPLDEEWGAEHDWPKVNPGETDSAFFEEMLAEQMVAQEDVDMTRSQGMDDVLPEMVKARNYIATGNLDEGVSVSDMLAAFGDDAPAVRRALAAQQAVEEAGDLRGRSNDPRVIERRDAFTALVEAGFTRELVARLVGVDPTRVSRIVR